VQTELTLLSDQELARLSQAGSLVHFEELVTRHEGRIFGFLVRCCGNEADARDLTQATFVAAHRALHRYQPAGAFAPWLFTIARNKFIDHSRAARPAVDLEDVPGLAQADNPADILARREDEQEIWRRARRILGQDQFEGLWLKYQEDLTIQEIARAMGRTQTSVKVLLFRARQNLLKAAEQLRAEAPPPLPAYKAVRPNRTRPFSPLAAQLNPSPFSAEVR
jgi:RNA polymerase sigma-70 factor, ECF subfamily